jgi:hypothetical protein
LHAHGRWYSPGTPASSTTKTGRHDIAEILLKVVLKHQKSKSINQPYRENDFKFISLKQFRFNLVSEKRQFINFLST